MQIKQFDAPSVLPKLDALEAEFGREAECTRQGSTAMDSTFTPTQSEFHTHLRTAKPTADLVNRLSLDPLTKRPSLARRVRRGSARFLIIFCLGIGATLAWQSYGDAARGMIAKSSPQLAWLAPSVVAAAAASPDLQQLALGLAAVRQSVDLLAGQLAAGQQQMESDIAKLQADRQEILQKLAAVPPRPAAIPMHKPAPVTPSSPPQARN